MRDGYGGSVADRWLRSIRVAPGAKVDLRQRSTNDTFGWDKAAAREELESVKVELDLLQQRLYAEQRRSVLLVLQAMDAAGKDGTIRSILSGLNPAGVQVTSFKVPGGPEAAHDYLWRVHQAAPGRGEIGVFNRSHYEDVIVVRVHGLVPDERWQRRYRHINEFERMLSDEGTSIIKVFLHVSQETQAQRFRERLDNPEKRWKYRAADLEDTARWPDFTAAYEAALSQTSTTRAPWYVVPADRNWVRNLSVAKVLLDVLRTIDPQLPQPEVVAGGSAA
jgi:PPK2 family polyphosphate:nucleotide phosphotransferase